LGYLLFWFVFAGQALEAYLEPNWILVNPDTVLFSFCWMLAKLGYYQVISCWKLDQFVKYVALGMDSLLSLAHYVTLELRFNGISAIFVHSEPYPGGHYVVNTVIWLGSEWVVLFCHDPIDLWFFHILSIVLWTQRLSSLAYPLVPSFMKCLDSPTLESMALQWGSFWIMVIVSLLVIILVLSCRANGF